MKIKNYLLLVIFSFAVSACGNNAFFKIGSQTQTFSQGSGTFSNQLDILWVVDNSASMVPVQNNMVANFGSIINSFQAKGYDFHMAVTTSDAFLGDPTLNNYNSLNAPYSLFRDGAGTNHSGVFVITPKTPNINNVFLINATQGAGGSGDERAFSSMRASLNNANNPAFLRSNAFLSVIILSDEDDFSGNTRAEYGNLDHDYTASTLDSVDTYINYLDKLTNSTPSFRRYNVNTIAVTDAACLSELLAQGQGSIMGSRYIEISQKTNGVIGSICDISFANTLNSIASQIITLSTQFKLNKIPQVDTIVVKVNGISILQNKTNGWSYNSAANAIMFHGTAVPPQGATISVTFSPVSI